MSGSRIRAHRGEALDARSGDPARVVSTAGDLDASPLGHVTTYAEGYDPGLLFAVDRAPQRALLRLDAALPFRGVDVWNAYEMSWLDAAGKPQVAIATFAVPAESPRLVESKSVKLYLTAMNQTRFSSERGWLVSEKEQPAPKPRALVWARMTSCWHCASSMRSLA